MEELYEMEGFYKWEGETRKLLLKEKKILFQARSPSLKGKIREFY